MLTLADDLILSNLIVVSKSLTRSLFRTAYALALSLGVVPSSFPPDKIISGVTIHLIYERLDTGNILFQKEVNIDQDTNTFKTSYQFLISEIEYLFKMNWKYLRTNECKGWKQQGSGTFHYAKDLEKVRPFLTKGWDTNISEFRTNYFKSINTH